MIAAHSAQAAFAGNRPEGRCANGPSIGSANIGVPGGLAAGCSELVDQGSVVGDDGAAHGFWVEKEFDGRAVEGGADDPDFATGIGGEVL